ncbi:TetR/AcrR family transcriptional regulator [Pinibacter aurantiacus]|uniref:TetR family transcriptional regulator n=1 Tax=Pinibacter aurantiacus TaxID=2851599 RepID=A0A9E2S3V7_9BACT|nr:TetR family transcriptional regulator [Pinibacter aurantiacus]MBV4356093.1 TetR family transcriptional regulator [Pinibacter aurantiacus]
MAKQKKDLSTEEKIKEAARKVFTSKGFAAARTRDIAEEAGMNLALLNYYFRSKEKLFEIVMIENLLHFISGIQTLLYDTTTSIEEKIDRLTNYYIDQIIEYPDLPLFILNALKSNSKFLKGKLNKNIMLKSHFMQQLQAELKKNKKTIKPLHFVINTFSMIIFPFVAKPLLMEVALSKDAEFIELMNERRKLIPIWIKTILRS